MLILDKDKENLLVEKYKFEKNKNIDDNNFYTLKSITIYCNDNENYLIIGSLSKSMQDVLYDLIKDDVLLKSETSEKSLKLKRIKKKEEQIKKLQDEINKIQTEIEE